MMIMFPRCTRRKPLFTGFIIGIRVYIFFQKVRSVEDLKGNDQVYNVHVLGTFKTRRIGHVSKLFNTLTSPAGDE